MATSVTAKNLVLNYLMRGVAGTAPSAWYVALFTDDPAESISNEVDVAEYVRKSVTFGAALGGVVRNAADVTWDETTEDWGTITHYAIFDAATDGNLLVSGTLDTDVIADTGTTLTLGAGTVEVTLE